MGQACQQLMGALLDGVQDTLSRIHIPLMSSENLPVFSHFQSFSWWGQCSGGSGAAVGWGWGVLLALTCAVLGESGYWQSQISSCNAEDAGSIPESGRSPGEGGDNPLQYSWLGNSIDRGAWWATVHIAKESDTTWRLNKNNPLRGIQTSNFCSNKSCWNFCAGNLGFHKASLVCGWGPKTVSRDCKTTAKRG